MLRRDFFLSCAYSKDRQHGILVFGKTEAVFLIVSTNNYLFGGLPRRHLESPHIEYRLWEMKHMYVQVQDHNRKVKYQRGQYIHAPESSVIVTFIYRPYDKFRRARTIHPLVLDP